MPSSPAFPASGTPSSHSGRPTRRSIGRQPGRLPRWGVLLLAVGATATALGAMVYAISRPCAIGGCMRLEQAEALQDEAIQRLRNEPSTTNLERGWQQLAMARESIAPIPVWSRHGDRASEQRAQLGRYQDELTTTISALSSGWEAAQLSQEAPHPLERWQQIEDLWARAIAQLEAVPETNVAYPVVQTKLTEYRQHLDAIRRRTVLERRAEEEVASARLAAEVAAARQENASNLGDWQQAHASWQLAVESLMRVPGGTTGADAAESLLANYTPQRDLAHRQREREQTGALRYERATEAADRAREALDAKRWETSIAYWEQAIANLREVPTQSSSAENARAALESHLRSLAQTVAAREMELHLAQVSKNLAELCRGATPICDYTVSDARIVVCFKTDYLKTVRDLDRQAAEMQSTETRVNLERHLQSTIDGFKAIADGAGLPLDAIDPDGKPLASYTPEEPAPTPSELAAESSES